MHQIANRNLFSSHCLFTRPCGLFKEISQSNKQSKEALKRSHVQLAAAHEKRKSFVTWEMAFG